MIVFERRFANLSGSRWDPHHYRPEFIELEANIRKLDCQRVGSIIQLSDEIWNQQDTFDEHFPYIEIGSIDLLLGRVDSISSIRKEDAPSRARLIVRSGDILVSLTRPNRGAIALVDKSIEIAIASTGFAVVRGVSNSKVTQRFLYHLLRSNICLQQFDRHSSGGNYPAITSNALQQVLIPIPSFQLQEAIVEKLDLSYQQYEEMSERAKALLASIDDLLLAELGIPHPPAPSYTLESRMFQRQFSEVSGKRIDPASSWKRLDFSASKFPLQPLREVASINPATVFPNVAPDTPISFVPMESVSDVFGEITHFQTRPIGGSRSYTTFQEGDVIWAKITPCMENGKSAVARNLEGGYGFGSTEFHVFRANPDLIHPDFLHHLLRLNTVRKNARLNFTGSSGHQRVDQDFFMRMAIPLPPLDTQRALRAKAEAAKLEAKNLFAQAQANLEQAKREIEAMILGEKVSQ